MGSDEVRGSNYGIAHHFTTAILVILTNTVTIGYDEFRHMIMKKILVVLLVMAMIFAAGIFFLFTRFGQNDAQALADFPAAYQKFERAISDYSGAVNAFKDEGMPVPDDLERKTTEALGGLKIKASARISSLTRNDADVMKIFQEIGDLSEKELDSLRVYQRAVADKNPDMDRFSKELTDFTNKRRTAYAHFEDLARRNE